MALYNQLTNFATKSPETGIYDSLDFRLMKKYGIPNIKMNAQGTRSNTNRSKQLLNSGLFVLMISSRTYKKFTRLHIVMKRQKRVNLIQDKLCIIYLRKELVFRARQCCFGLLALISHTQEKVRSSFRMLDLDQPNTSRFTNPTRNRIGVVSH